MRKNFILILVCLMAICHSIDSQDIGQVTEEIVTQNFLTQLNLYPQEKIHLHLDRDMYVSGEKIWFKAYLVDAATHLYPTLSRYVYVELISPDTLISRVMIRPDENNLYHGCIPINEIIPEGDYTIRAYTRHMENLGEDYFFQKNIRIEEIKTNENKASTPNKRQRTAKREKDDYVVSFFPEGGNLLEGTLCNIGFKALNNKGLAEPISGTIVDEEGKTIIEIVTEYAGMGRFGMVPAKGKSYYLKCTNQKGISKRFELPKAVPDAHSLSILWKEDKLYISQKRSAGTPSISSSVLLHCREDVIYYEPWDNDREYIVFDKIDLPAGVIQIVLFDNQLNPLSERIAFCKKEESVQVHYQTNKESFTTREKVSSVISVQDTLGIPLLANLSVAITDKKDVPVDESSTILSSLLLSSELKGYIENPGYYFMNNTIETDMALDNLMLIQGWKRYNIPEVIKGNFTHMEKGFETAQTINGTVKTFVFFKPIENSSVVILSNGNFAFCDTDENGRFSFTDFEEPDSSNYFIQSRNKKGGENVKIEIDKIVFPQVKHTPTNENPVFTYTKKEEIIDRDFIEKAAKRSLYDEEMRIIHLAEIEVLGAKKRQEERDLPWYSMGADNTVKGEEVIKKWSPTYVTDMLRGLPGVVISPEGNVNIVGSSSFMITLENEDGSEKENNVRVSFPLVLIDGIAYVPTEAEISYSNSPLEYVNVNDVDRIDIFKGATAGFWGLRGSNGVISIKTKSGIVEKRIIEKHNQTVVTPLGYQKPVEFYSPKYETPESKYTGNPDYRTTIFWKPDIITTEDSEVSFEFYTADTPTTYSVVIEGLTQDGSIVRDVREITVE